MASPISSVSSIYNTYQPVATPPAKAAPSAPQDSVHLSSKALAAAGGDVDHDGDSH